MKRRILSLTNILGAVAALASPAGAQGDAPPPVWSDRGVFVFGGLLLDFQRGSARFGPFAYDLTNCSDTEYYCAKSEPVTLVLPRWCESKIEVGRTWTHEGIETSVVGKIEAPPAHLSVPGRVLYVLRSNASPNTAYLYNDGSGSVSAILYDSVKPLDLSWLPEGETAKFDLISGSPERQRLLKSLLTLDKFGPCAPQRRGG
jgi:hypothetical protein